MIKRILFILAAIHCTTALASVENSPFLFSESQPQHIFVNNRILAQVNGNAISVIDVMKKMDMLFYRQFPQFSSSTEARFQFYQVNWKHLLNELVDKELILADATENKQEISNGDIRQEMETFFGPNIIANLDKAGLTHDEAWKMVKEDLMIRRMLMIRVNSKAVRAVTPNRIRAAYEEYAKENVRPDSWKYQVITIRGEDANAEAGNYAYNLLVEEMTPINELPEKMQKYFSIDNKTSVNVSEVFTHSDGEISEAYKNILISLERNTFSQPIAQESRANQSMVFRIFHLIEKTPGGVSPFNEVENTLKNMLTDREIDKETEQYITKLRKHFIVGAEGHNQTLSEDFQPFVLK